jgi:uncharacterized membrane protein
MKFASEGIKSLFILNGAATISVLTFVGNSQNGDDRFVYAMFLFACGAFLGPVAYLFAYLTELQYGNSAAAPAWKHHKLTYAVVLLSMICFFAGVLLAGLAFLTLGGAE